MTADLHPWPDWNTALHWAHLLDAGAPVELRSGRLCVVEGDAIRSCGVGGMSLADLRIRARAILSDMRRALPAIEAAAISARIGIGQTKLRGLSELVACCAGLAPADRR